jgi:DNA-binding NarL/FixJ family response regulator
MYAMSHRILIVDDDPHIRQVLSFALGKAGMETSEAEDGEAALSAIGARRPDLVVSTSTCRAWTGWKSAGAFGRAAIFRSFSCPHGTTRSTASSAWSWAATIMS